MCMADIENRNPVYCPKCGGLRYPNYSTTGYEKECMCDHDSGYASSTGTETQIPIKSPTRQKKKKKSRMSRMEKQAQYGWKRI